MSQRNSDPRAIQENGHAADPARLETDPREHNGKLDRGQVKPRQHSLQCVLLSTWEMFVNLNKQERITVNAIRSWQFMYISCQKGTLIASHKSIHDEIIRLWRDLFHIRQQKFMFESVYRNVGWRAQAELELDPYMVQNDLIPPN